MGKDKSSSQMDPTSKNRHIHWNDVMDNCMISALYHQVLTGHKRSDNGVISSQVSKVIESVNNECGVVVSKKNVRARLKTIKKE